MMDADAIVVGAGPAGASAAFHLAKRGRRVLLLERARFPRDKSCGDGLTRFTTRQLAEMGVLDVLLDAAESHGVRVRMRGHAHRDFRYPDDPDPRHQGRVVPRAVLDHEICRQAQAAGAVLCEDTLASELVREADGSVAGVVARRNGETLTLRARVVVAADGAASRLAKQVRLSTGRPGAIGYAIRGYYDGIEDLGGLLEIYMPLFDVTDRYLLPSYGWVFPTGPSSANIGVGLVRRERDANVSTMLERFVAELRTEQRFRSAVPRGEWRGAPLRFDFHPDRCVAPGIVLVGDAAGMISPFTGEGIGYALTSGRLAAETIDAALEKANGPALDLSAYPAALARRFTGYFEAGRESAHRYKLVWHVLENTFENEKPLFNICRRAALFPEGIGASYIREAFEDVGPVLRGGAASSAADRELEADLATVRADLLGVGEVLIGTVRENWPFLTRVVAVEETAAGLPFRPALLLLLVGRIAEPRRSLLVSIAAAIEMGFVAALAHASIGDEAAPTDRERDVRPANWGNRFALMLGDFLLANAYTTTAEAAGNVSREIAAAISVASEGHLRGLRHAYGADLAPAEYLDMLAQKAGTLFELPCRLGARLADATPRIVGALSEYGRALGVAYQLAYDLRGEESRAGELGRAIAADPAAGLYAYATIHALQTEFRDPLRRALARLRQDRGAQDEVRRLVEEAGGTRAAGEEIRRAVGQAKAALERVPSGGVRTWLGRLADWIGSQDPTIAPQSH